MAKKKQSARKLRENVFQHGPHLIAAILCEKLLSEQDGVKSAIRIVDRVTHAVIGPDVPDKMPPVPVNFDLLVKLKTGDRPGKYEMRVTMVNPRGQDVQSFSQTVKLEGGPNRGMDLRLNLNLRLDQEGIYWFEIWCDDFLMTKTPLEIMYIIQKRTGPQPPGLIQ
ncbi:hypothetical protein MYX84_12290 [Acidobacteria bacterium AH-259-O06]|nr:hypothetical protein [Acidobacteria bacterium AH-259-O06]